MSEQTPKTDDDDKSSSSRNNPVASRPRKKNVYRGVLATLRDVDHCHLHSRDEEELRNTKLLLRRSTSRRKNTNSTSKNKSPQSTIPTTTTTILPDIFANSEFTILFFFDPRQQHSLLLRSTISDFCHRNNDKVCCLAMFGGDPQAATKEDMDDSDLFYRGTGFLEVSTTTTTNSQQQLQQDDNKISAEQQLQQRRSCVLNLLKFLDVTQIPNVTIVPNSTGRPIMGQEMAMEWNVGASTSTSTADADGGDSSSTSENDKNDAELLQRWREGKSGLTLSQNIVSKVLGDSNSVCAVM